MKHVKMPQGPDKPKPIAARKPRRPEKAFDLWLERGLHRLFDDVAREPIPEELLKIIEQDRTK